MNGGHTCWNDQIGDPCGACLLQGIKSWPGYASELILASRETISDLLGPNVTQSQIKEAGRIHAALLAFAEDAPKFQEMELANRAHREALVQDRDAARLMCDSLREDREMIYRDALERIQEIALRDENMTLAGICSAALERARK